MQGFGKLITHHTVALIGSEFLGFLLSYHLGGDVRYNCGVSPLPIQWRSLSTCYSVPSIQGSTKRWALGCMNSPPVQTSRGSQEAGFTHPRAHFYSPIPVGLYILYFELSCLTLTAHSVGHPRERDRCTTDTTVEEQVPALDTGKSPFLNTVVGGYSDTG